MIWIRATITWWLLSLAGVGHGSAQAVPQLAEVPEVLSGKYRYVSGRQYAPGRGGRTREIDFYLPAENTQAPLLVWFHGGGLTGGAPSLPAGLRQQGLGVAIVRYRLADTVSVRDKIRDAAAAVAYVLAHGDSLGYDAAAVTITGHSAGGYLASMVALDSTYLASFGHHPRELQAVAPFSGHTITHFTERAARGMPQTQVVVDSLAPLFHVRKQSLPFLLLTGDAELELLGRHEEVAYFWRMMRLAGNEEVLLYELGGYGHDMVAPGIPLLLQFVRERNPAR